MWATLGKILANVIAGKAMSNGGQLSSVRQAYNIINTNRAKGV